MKKRSFVAGWLVLLALSFSTLVAPITRILGYEFAATAAVRTGLFGFFLGMLFGRLERDEATLPPSAGSAVLASALVLLTPVSVVAMFSVGITVLTSPCDPIAGFWFLPVLVVPSALVSSAAGVVIGLFTRSTLKATLLVLMTVLVSAMWTCVPIVLGPQVFAYEHFTGFLPGPLYDEDLRLMAPLLWYRVATLALAGALICLANAQLNRTTWALFAVCAATFFAIELSGTHLGFRTTDASLENELSFEVLSEHIRLRHAGGIPADKLARMVDDLEFRHAQITTFLGDTPPGRATVWLYKNATEKRRLVGAALTQFAKPWRNEVHINAMTTFPHPIVKHELAHALASTWGRAPFGVTLVGGVLPNAGLIEGLAVAADNPIDDLTLHDWAAAMKKKGLLPDVVSLFSLNGFYAAPPSRAYSAAGSFVRWLRDAKGAQKLREVYADADFQRVYGQSLETLATDWNAFLDAQTIDEVAMNQAFARFRQGSLFDRPCAREVASRVDEARSLLGENADRALTMYQRCSALQPEEPNHVMGQAEALRQLGRNADALTLLNTRLAQLGDAPTEWSNAALLLAQLHLELGHLDEARSLLNGVLERAPAPALLRTVLMYQFSFEQSPAVRAAVWRFLSPASNDTKRLYSLETVALKEPAPELSYLLGRMLAQHGEHADALPWLQQAAASATLHSAIRKEALRLTIETATALHDCQSVKAALNEAPTFGSTFVSRMEDWQARCAFQARAVRAGEIPAQEIPAGEK